MKKMIVILGIVLIAGASGCTTNNFYSGQMNECSTKQKTSYFKIKKQRPVEFYTKSTYVISRDVMP